jgi:hypothetical protein
MVCWNCSGSFATMSMKDLGDVKGEVLAILQRYSKKQSIKEEEFVGRDVGIRGDYSIDLLYELEDRFGIDLDPLIQEHSSFLPPTWFDRLRGKENGPSDSDVTVKQLTDYIANVLRQASDGS